MKRYALFSSAVVSCFAAALNVSAQAPTPITSAGPDFQDTYAAPLEGNSTELKVGTQDTLSGTFNIGVGGDSGGITISTATTGNPAVEIWAGKGAGNVYNDEVGFDSLTETAVSATLDLWIKTTTGSTVDYSVNLGDLGGSSTDIPGANNGKIAYDFTSVDGSGGLSSGVINILNNDDGQLSYSIQNAGTGNGVTDFTVEYMVLQVDTEPTSNATSTPDGGATLLLLGASLASLACFKTTRRQKS